MDLEPEYLDLHDRQSSYKIFVESSILFHFKFYIDVISRKMNFMDSQARNVAG